VFQKFSLDITLEASTYLTKKTAITMVIMPETGGEPVRVVIAFSADAYGEPVVVEVPSTSVPLEDFILELQQTFMGPSMGGGMGASADPYGYGYGYESDYPNQEMYAPDQSGVLGAFQEYFDGEQK
jgi:hypothetical protein